MKKFNKTLLLASTLFVSTAITNADQSFASEGYDLDVEPSTSTNLDNDQLITEETEVKATEEGSQFDATVNYEEYSLETEEIPQDYTYEAEEASTLPAETDTEASEENLSKENFDDVVYYDTTNLDQVFDPAYEYKAETEFTTSEKAVEAGAKVDAVNKDFTTKEAPLAKPAATNEETETKTEEVELTEKNFYAPKGTGYIVNEAGTTKYYENNKLVKDASVVVNNKFYNIDSKGNATNPKSIWGRVGSDIYYIDETGSVKTGIADVKNEKYYFNNQGVLQRNKKIVTGEAYYDIDNNGKMTAPKNTWVNINGNKYYNDNNGKLLRGIANVKGTSYYFDDNGKLATNKKLVADDKYYIVNGNGVATNMKNTWFSIGGNTYRSDENGKLSRGAKTIDGKTYVFDTNGVMAQNQTILSAGKFYQVDNKGVATNPKNSWVTHNGHKYHTNEAGYVKEGVWRIDNEYYYFTENGLTPNQTVTQKGVIYTVDAKGVATKQDNNIPGEKSIDKVMEWMFNAKDSKMTYNMGAARTSAGSADCSSAVYRSLIYAGFLEPGTWVGNTETLFQMGARGKVMYEIKESEIQHGDIFVAGRPGASIGADGHTGFILNPKEDTIIHMNYSSNGVSVTPRKGYMGDRRGLPVKYYRLVGASSTGKYLNKK